MRGSGAADENNRAFGWLVRTKADRQPACVLSDQPLRLGPIEHVPRDLSQLVVVRLSVLHDATVRTLGVEGKSIQHATQQAAADLSTDETAFVSPESNSRTDTVALCVARCAQGVQSCGTIDMYVWSDGGFPTGPLRPALERRDLGAWSVGLSDLSSVRELAEYLGVPLATVYRWNYLGTGPQRLVIGRHVRYRRADVERWLASRVAS
jgi:excisionase family DNA binding protein